MLRIPHWNTSLCSGFCSEILRSSLDSISYPRCTIYYLAPLIYNLLLLFSPKITMLMPWYFNQTTKIGPLMKTITNEDKDSLCKEWQCSVQMHQSAWRQSIVRGRVPMTKRPRIVATGCIYHLVLNTSEPYITYYTFIILIQFGYRNKTSIFLSSKSRLTRLEPNRQSKFWIELTVSYLYEGFIDAKVTSLIVCQ